MNTEHAIFDKIDFRGYGDSEDRIKAAFLKVYATQAGKNMIDAYLSLSEGNTIVIENVSGLARAYGGIVNLDPSFAENRVYLNKSGDAVQVTLEGVLAHELVHALTINRTDDDWVDSGSYASTTIDLANIIFKEMGLDEQISYPATSQKGAPLVLGENYFEGQAIDRVIVETSLQEDNIGWTFAGNGNDLFIGGAKISPVSGGAGDDILHGGAGADTLNGDEGNDKLYGHSEDGEGDDNANDILDGGAGDDELYGGGGDDELNGGDGNDIIDGGEGEDTVDYSEGGSTDLVLSADEEDSEILSITVLDASSGDNDTLTNVEIIKLDTNGNHSFSINEEILNTKENKLEIEAGSGDNDEIDFSTSFEGIVYIDDAIGHTDIIISDIEIITGSEFDDSLAGDDEDTEIDGKGGDDNLFGLGGEDTISGGEGDDVIEGGEDNDTITAGAGENKIIVGEGDDIVLEGDADDRLYFRLTNIETDADTQDVVSILGGWTAVYEWPDGPLSNHEINIGDIDSDNEFPVTFSPITQTGPYAEQIDNLLAGEQDYTLVYEYSGGDLVISISYGISYTNGLAGFELPPVHATVTIKNYKNGDYGLTFFELSEPNEMGGGEGLVTVPQQQIDVVKFLTNNLTFTEIDTYEDLKTEPDGQEGDSGDDDMAGTEGNDTINSGGGNDIVNAGIGNDRVRGGSEDDIINGEEGNDHLFGDDGNDIISGGSGNDLLSGGKGVDELSGGSGSDDYIVKSNTQMQTIYESDITTAVGASVVSLDVDRILLSEDVTVDNIILTQDGDDLIITLEGGTTARVVNQLKGIEYGIEEIVFSDGTIWTRDNFVLADPDHITANDDSFTTDEDVAITIPASELLVNDSDVDGDDLTITSVQDATNGTVSLDVDGNVIFVPNVNYNGNASFTYTASDGNGAEDTATVAITVNVINDAPIVGDVDLGAIDEDNSIIITGTQLLANSSDIDGDNLTITVLTVAASIGIVVANADNTWTFTPVANFNGNDVEFNFTVSDGIINADASATLNVSAVNDSPIAANDDSFTTDEDVTITILASDLLVNDSDVDGDDLTITSVQNALNGTVNLDTDGNVIFTPNTSYNGIASFTYTISDGNGGENTATAELTVNPADVSDNTPTNGDDDLTGSNQDDIISALDGNDTIFGLAGDDVLNGNDGDDLLIGGEGADTLDGGAGFDTASYESATSDVYVHMSDVSHNTGDALGDTYIFVENLKGSDHDDTLIATDNDNFIWGDDGDDSIVGLDGNDTIYGGAGNDDIYGNEGNDVLFGGEGNDVVFGYEDDDRIDLGEGDDFAVGGTGNDTFVFRPGLDNNLISDFQGGAGASDVIELEGMGISSYAQLQTLMSEWNGTTYIDFDADNSITLSGVTMASLDQDDFNFV